jgi:hypothetical protein
VEAFAYQDLGGTAGTFNLPPQISDFDGDGRADVLRRFRADGRDHFIVNRSIGSSFGPATEWTSTDNTGYQVFFADVNGDRLPDFVLQLDYGGRSLWDVRINTGTSFVRTTDVLATAPQTALAIVDFNGDGRADLLSLYHAGGRDHFVVHRSIGSSFEGDGPATEWTSTDNTGYQVFFADVNGDRLPDFVLQLDYGGRSLWDVRTNTGSSFVRIGNIQE